MKPLLIIIICVIVLYLFKVFYWDAESEVVADTGNNTEAAKVVSLLPVDIYVAKETSQSNVVIASGTIVPNEEVEVKSEASGRLTKLYINEGAYVQKGQLIAKLNDEELRSQLKKLKYEAEFAAQTEQRQRKLLDIDAISKEEYDIAVNRVNTLGADKEYLEVQLEKTSITAPFSGRMGLKNISEGAYITPNVIIANLVQTNPAKIDFDIPEKYASKIKVGQDITFTLDGYDETFQAKVIALNPKIDEELRTLKVRAKAPNFDGKLLPGMFTRIELPLGDERSIMIPSESIIPILKGKKVYVMKNGLAKETIISTGLRTDEKVSVEKGLAIGDSVIVSALMSVKQDLPVTARNIVQ
jgi:membrane fusion protein (multidrug efflux system)